MWRRTFLAASAATLALPAVGQADNKRVLRFIAQSDLAILDPVWTFLKTYFVQAGFLDGVEGLTIAYMAALYTFLKYAKARNMSS